MLALAENAIGAASYRPSDVLRLFDGTTVEVVDTDAEGRLVLADALGWVLARFRPQAVIDLGTLTGSIVTALGHHMAGLFATDDALAAHVAAAGAAVQELAWRMPLAEGYREALDSAIADLRHCSDGTASRTPAKPPPSCAASSATRHGRIWILPASNRRRRRATDTPPGRPAGASGCSIGWSRTGSRTRIGNRIVAQI